MSEIILKFCAWFGIAVALTTAVLSLGALSREIYCRLKWRHDDKKEKKRIKVYQFKYCFMEMFDDDQFCERNEQIIFNTRNEMEMFIKAKNVSEAIVEFFKTKPFDTLIRKVKEVG